ncbi:hypothetical protein KCU88_g161, partial [Aureobasidium melanogenum]
MEAYNVIDPLLNFHPLPYPLFENSTLFPSAPMQTTKDDMFQIRELPPSLVSSDSIPSIASASSSTMGSPYSEPLHTFSSQDGYDHGSSYGLGAMPCIVQQESFQQDLLGESMEAELSLGSDRNLDDKVSVDSSFVATIIAQSTSNPDLDDCLHLGAPVVPVRMRRGHL